MAFSVATLLAIAFAFGTPPRFINPYAIMTPNTKESKYLQGMWLLGILLGILVVGFILRFAFLQSIPEYQVDEGSWNIGARDKLVDGDWCYTIRKFCVAPVHEAIYYLWFLIVGSGLYQARILAVLFNVGSILLMYLIGKRLFGTRTGLIAAALFAINYILILTGRRAMLETDSIFWILLAMLLFLQPNIIFRILSGIVLALAISTKLYAAKLLPVFAIYDIMALWAIDHFRSLRALFKPQFLVFLAAVVAGVASIYGLVYHYYPAEFQFERSCYWEPISLIPKLLGHDSTWFSAKYFLIRDGLTLLLSFLAVLFLLKKWRRTAAQEESRYFRNVWFVFHWTWIAFLGVLLMGFQPPRYYSMVIPAYILLAAVFMDRQFFQAGSAQGKSWRRRLGLLVLGILFLFSLSGKIWFYLISGERNTSAPDALAWVKAHVPHSASIAADYYMAVSLPEYQVWPLHPQRYYALPPGKKWQVDDYFVDPFGIPAYYSNPIPGRFRNRVGDMPDYVLLPVNHGETGEQERFDRFMRSPIFNKNFTVMKEFIDPNGFQTILFINNSPANITQ
jgi:4-amino-4-deoxy-L-arabinose transferase-like glycosyltransferase